MTKIESKKVTVDCSAAEVFAYLTDLNNFLDLLPQNKISNWESDTEQCSFRIQGTITVCIKLKTAEEHSVIHLVSGDKSPFPFTLDINISDAGADACNVGQKFQADINPFLKMMVEKPLTNLFNYIADKLVEVKSKS